MLPGFGRPILVWSLLGLLCLPGASARAAEKLAVRDLAAREPFRQGLADMLTDRLIADLKALGRLEVFARPEVQAAVDRLTPDMKLDPKCENDGCLEEVGKSLGADLVLSGYVGLAGSRHLVTLSLRRTGSGQKAQRRTWECDCPVADLAGNLTAYARELLGLGPAAQTQGESGWAAERRVRDDAERAEKERLAAEKAAREVAEFFRSLGIEMVRIPGGEFEMGSNEYKDEKPVHRVRVQDFFLGKTEVTQDQWAAVMGGNPSEFGRCGGDCPVEQVSWEDAQAFIEKLKQRTGKRFRLPTEAEWEYAAGDGSRHRKWAGTESEPLLGDYCWYEANSAGKTHPVGQKRPNEFGLYDMSGNVLEWCSDWFGDYPSERQESPAGPLSGTGRVDRGGAWDGDPWSERVAHRFGLSANYRSARLGFRLALTSGW